MAFMSAVPLFAAPVTPPTTQTFTDSVTFGLTGANGAASGLFDQVEAQFVDRGRTYILSSVDVTWATTTNVTQARVFNDSTTQSYRVTGLEGTNTFSLLTANGGSVFDTDITNWTATVNTNVAPSSGSVTSAFSTGTAGDAFTVTSADGALFNWFIGNGQTSFWLTNSNSVSANITSVPANTLNALRVENRASGQSASGTINLVYTYTMSSVPEASSVVMGSFGILGLIGAGLFRRRSQSTLSEYPVEDSMTA